MMNARSQRPRATVADAARQRRSWLAQMLARKSRMFGNHCARQQNGADWTYLHSRKIAELRSDLGSSAGLARSPAGDGGAFHFRACLARSRLPTKVRPPNQRNEGPDSFFGCSISITSSAMPALMTARFAAARNTSSGTGMSLRKFSRSLDYSLAFLAIAKKNAETKWAVARGLHYELGMCVRYW